MVRSVFRSDHTISKSSRYMLDFATLSVSNEDKFFIGKKNHRFIQFLLTISPRAVENRLVKILHFIHISYGSMKNAILKISKFVSYITIVLKPHAVFFNTLMLMKRKKDVLIAAPRP